MGALWFAALGGDRIAWIAIAVALTIAAGCCFTYRRPRRMSTRGTNRVAREPSEMTDGPPPHEVKTRRCTIHVGRFRWDIVENGKPISSSPDSFATRDEAHKDGLEELRRLAEKAR
jgi:hypothetical protein